MRASRFHFCRSCDRETAQRFVGREAVPGFSPDDRQTEFYSCRSCGMAILKYADVDDAEGLIVTFYARATRGSGSTDYGDVKSAEREDVIAALRLALWKAYRQWEPIKCARFRAFGWTKLGHALSDYYREQNGMGSDGPGAPRRPPKTLSVARSIDALRDRFFDEADTGRVWVDPVEQALGSSVGDPLDDSLTDLEREITRRGRRFTEAVALLGRSEDARVAS